MKLLLCCYIDGHLVKSLTIATRKSGGVDSLVLSDVLKETQAKQGYIFNAQMFIQRTEIILCLIFYWSSTSSFWLCEEVILRLFFASVFEVWMQITKKLNKRRWMYKNICSLLTQYKHCKLSISPGPVW